LFSLTEGRKTVEFARKCSDLFWRQINIVDWGLRRWKLMAKRIVCQKMENLFVIATVDNHVEKTLHNHNNNQTNPKKQPKTKNKPQKTITDELVNTKHPQQQPNKNTENTTK